MSLPRPSRSPTSRLHRTTVAILLGAASSVLLSPAPGLLANGGTLRVSDAPVGGYRVSVYTDPTPPRPDSLDVSVLVLRPGEAEPVEGLEVRVRGRPLAGDDGAGAAGTTGSDGTRQRVDVPATREQADDPRYYAAKFSAGGPGRWRFTVALRGPEGEGEVSFELELREPGLLDRPGVVLLLALLPLLLLAAWLARPSAASPPNSPA